MNNKRSIAIIGAGGRMGKWFYRYFAQHTLTGKLSLYDKNPLSSTDYPKADIYNDVHSCVHGADFIILCVPINAVSHLIDLLSASLKKGAVIAEISSVKSESIKALRRTEGKIRPLCIHPMFGPGAGISDKIKIIMIPVRDAELEVSLIEEYFAGALIKVFPDESTHDRSMAIVLGLTYFVNLAMARILSLEHADKINDAAGTTFTMQSLICQSIMTDDPNLVSGILISNPATKTVINDFLNTADDLADSLNSGQYLKIEQSFTDIKSKMEHSFNIDIAYQKLYALFDFLKEKEVKRQ